MAIDELEHEVHRKFFKALLGGVLVDISNVVVSGKGRRYRQNWLARQASVENLTAMFRSRVERPLLEVAAHAARPESAFTMRRGDCRPLIETLPRADLTVFSPPYLNSFDYTDVYNVELWMLGYLQTSSSNRPLRQSTLLIAPQIATIDPSERGIR